MDETTKLLAMGLLVSAVLIVKDVLMLRLIKKREVQSPQTPGSEMPGDNLKAIREHAENLSFWAWEIQEEAKKLENAAIQYELLHGSTQQNGVSPTPENLKNRRS